VTTTDRTLEGTSDDGRAPDAGPRAPGPPEWAAPPPSRWPRRFALMVLAVAIGVAAAFGTRFGTSPVPSTPP
jgi:hypothetical protein